jgi:hypothetical protein
MARMSAVSMLTTLSPLMTAYRENQTLSEQDVLLMLEVLVSSYQHQPKTTSPHVLPSICCFIH